mmetsp:Transcript_70632/g.196488  ORF Transcript_70632/g.196488 Transcript_70632/m.196488 type:complete len:286 (-) Transcript_70632:90-947(-)
MLGTKSRLTDSDSENSENEREWVDVPILLSELSAVILGILATVLLLCAVGLCTVNPPGEEDLCRVETLGLANETKSKRDSVLTACHGLYTGVFALCAAMSVPFFAVALVGLTAAGAVCSGARAQYDPRTSTCFCCSALLGVMGAGLTWLPSMIYPGVATAMAAAMAPIYAHWLVITVGHYSMKGVSYTTDDGHVRDAAYITSVLYQGYSAVYRVNLCLMVGGVCLLALFWVFLADVVRSAVSILCVRPKFNRLHGEWQCCILKRRCRSQRGDGGGITASGSDSDF